jgi:hypothetical protein
VPNTYPAIKPPDDPPIPVPLPTDEFTAARLDLFPATVTHSDGTVYANVRILITTENVFLLKDAPTSGPPQIFLCQRLDDAWLQAQTYFATLADGSTLQAVRGGGCGCGSQVRGCRPFSGGLSAMQSLEKRAPT